MAKYEEVIERIGDHVVQSNLREATDAEIKEAEELHKQGKCPHTIVQDSPGWLYDLRTCVTCGAGLGMV